MIELSENILYDTTKDYNNQDAEVKSWIVENLMKDEYKEVTHSDFCGLDLNSNDVNRPCCEVYTNLGFKLEIRYKYKYPATDRRCFAFSKITYNLIKL